MKQKRRGKMLLHIVFSLLVLSVIAESCDMETHYMKDSMCCKLCEPGKRMRQIGTCEDPVCEECEDGEYQDKYNQMFQCKPQPSCDPNLNLEKRSQSKKEYTPCRCIPNHHCSGPDCVSCVRNTVCKAGEKISKNSTQMSDTECEPCPNATFSDRESAVTCKRWTECSSGFIEGTSGSSTSDRICEVNKKLTIVTPLVITMLILAVVGGLGYCFYRKYKTGSASFVQKLQLCTVLCIKNTHPPAQDNVFVENVENGQEREQEQPPRNQPQEDTEDLLKHEPSLIPGISENGLPVSQDHSKSFLLSETETEPESITVHL